MKASLILGQRRGVRDLLIILLLSFCLFFLVVGNVFVEPTFSLSIVWNTNIGLTRLS